MSDLDQNSIAARSVALGHIASLRDIMDTRDAENGLRPPLTVHEHVLRVSESTGALAMSARHGSDTTAMAMTVAADALGLIEFLAERERRS